MNDIEVSLQDTQDISTQVYDINYIPDYVKAEEERRANETIRISNEQNRQANELLRVALYNDLEEKKEQDYWRGNGIVSTTKTGTSGLVDTYTITYDDGDTDTFTVTNGQDGDPGQDGQDATINGVNTLTIQEGENISITQSGSTMTISSTGGSGGTSDYTDLTNKPSINNVTLSGNKSLSDLGIQPSGDYITNTDYATSSNGGVVKVDDYYGVDDTDGGRIRASNYTYSQYESKSNNAFISKGTLENVVTGKGLVTQSGVMTYLGDCGDYSTSNYLDITGIKKGIYVLSAYDDTAISLQMTFKGTTSTARYTQVGIGDRLFGCNYYIYISQDVTDELADNVIIGCLTFNTMGGGTNYDLKTRMTAIKLTNKMLDLSVSSVETRNLNLVDKEQSISRKKTFSVLPESSVTPTANNQLVNKKYVDDSIASAITDALQGGY